MSKILEGKFKYVEGTKNEVVCTYCDKKFRYHHSTSSLKYHLANFHAHSAKNATESEGSSTKEKQQQRLDQFQSTKLTQAKVATITTALASWVGRNSRPLAIVEDDGLENLIRICTSNSEYKLPTRQTVKKRLDDTFQQKKTDIQDELSNAQHIGLTCDYWTSTSNENYLGMTAHFLDRNFKLISHVLDVSYSTERHTAENVASHIGRLTEEWGITSKVVAMVTNNARNM